MKNKIIVLIFIAIMCTCIGLLVGCTHFCTFGEWTEIKAATCTSTGLKERVCSCSKKEEEIIPLNLSNHNFEEINGTEQTLHTNGIKNHKHCTLCNKNFDKDTNVELNDEDLIVNATHLDSYNSESLYCELCDKYIITTAEQFIAFRDNVNKGNKYLGKIVILNNDIDLNNIEWIPINKFGGIFDGEGHTIYNLKISSGDNNVGLFGDQWQVKTEIRNFTLDGVNIIGGEFVGGVLAKTASTKLIGINIKNAVINATHYAGGILGYGYTSVDGCTAENVTITCIPNAVENGFDNGDKVGGIVGCLFSGSINNCTAKNITLQGYRDIGGIVGMLSNGDGAVSAKNNTSDNIKICVDQITNHYGNKDTNAGGIIGRNIGATTDNNISTNLEIEYKLKENE